LKKTKQTSLSTDPVDSIRILCFVGQKPNWTFNTNFVL